MELRSIHLNNWLIVSYAVLFVILSCYLLDPQIYSLGDDISQYIQHARNIRLGYPYSALPYPFNPLSQIGPPAYPPVYPLLISPFTYGVFPQIIWMKSLSVFLFGLSILILYKIFSLFKAPTLTLEALLVFSFLPWIFHDAGYLGSDTPYGFFSFLVLWSLIALPDDRPAWSASILTGFLMALATLTRDTGIALWVSSLIYLSHKIWNNQRSRFFLITQMGFISLAFLLPLISWKLYQDYLGLGPDNAIYFKTALGWDHLTILEVVRRMISNFFYYLIKGYELLFPLSHIILPYPYLNWLRFPLAALILIPLGWQIIKGFRSPQLPIVLYLGCYLSIFLILEFHISRNGSRMLIPLAPFLVYFTLKGFQELFFKRQQGLIPLSFHLLVVVWIGLNFFGTFSFYSTLRDPKSLAFSPEGPKYQAMIAYIQREIPSNDRIAYIKPRYLSLYTNHPTVIPPYMGPPSLIGPPAEILGYLSHWQVRHVLLDDHFVTEETSLRKTMAQFPNYFSPRFSLPPLTLYQFKTP